MRLLLGLDLGTSGVKAYLLDEAGRRAGLGYCAVRRLPTEPGLAELDPLAVAASAAQAIRQALEFAEAQPGQVLAVGLASQRDTDFIWDAATRQPLASAISWQDLRTSAQAEAHADWQHASELRQRLGYYPGPWCAANHLAWRALHQPEFQQASAHGRLRIGMAAGWLLAAMGQPEEHRHDYSLVQKTGLWDIRQGDYWDAWISYLGLSRAGLPQAAPTLHHYGTLRLADSGMEAPVLAMLGDQQAALFGYGCRLPGQSECTHGTATFVNVFAGEIAPHSDNLNVYHAWTLGEGQPHTYCLEADTTASGSAVRWMSERAGLLEGETSLHRLGSAVPDAGGVIFVPAFTGLNVPYNDHHARATLLGLTLNHDRRHIARAFLEALGFQVRAILETVQAQTGLSINEQYVGGGLSRADLACQVQADLTGVPVYRPDESETTARGAALLAGMGAGVWRSVDELPPLPPGGAWFEPRLDAARRDEGYARWQKAVAFVRAWGSN